MLCTWILLSHKINNRFSHSGTHSTTPKRSPPRCQRQWQSALQHLPCEETTGVMQWKVSTAEKPDASRKWASPSDKEMELNHKEQRERRMVSSLGWLDLGGCRHSLPSWKGPLGTGLTGRADQQLDLWRTDREHRAISVRLEQQSLALGTGTPLGGKCI